MKPKWRREFDERTGPPGPPDVFRGTLYVGASPAPTGVTIQACIASYSRGECVTGEGGSYYIEVPQEGIHPDDIGQTVTFWANQVKCQQESQIIGKLFDTGAQELDLHVGALPTPPGDLQPEIDAVANSLEQLALSWDVLKASLDAQGEAQSPFYPPYSVLHKLWPGSVNYLGEFVTPYAAAVQEKAATIRDRQGEALIEAAFRCVYEGAIKYVTDISVYGFDRWQAPAETLAKGVGDCEDKANLFVSLMIAAGWPREEVFAAGWKVNGNGHEWAVVRLEGQWYTVECTANDWHGLLTYDDFKEQLGLEYVESIKFNDKMVLGVV